MKKWLKDWLPSLFIALILSFILQNYIAQAVTIPSESMIPTLNINDKLIINKLIKPEDLEYGDIVVFYSPVTKGERYIKRLIGIGGDTIEIKNGYLYRNGERIHEPYLVKSIDYEFGPVLVPEDNYFFLGDNRNSSYDSHLWPYPFIEKEKLIGKAVFRYYPFSRVKKF
ncbi:MAG TPA: signal peptidase I [Eubacteriaceae bacterium]|jgi:signal peptidase I|nr:signal peptidase I [Eubacteriaceae bacterium]